MEKLTDDADYEAGETFENVSSPLSDAGNHDNYHGRRLGTRCVLHGLPVNKTKLRQRGQPTSMKETDLLVSFDVESMYTNISGENALMALLEMLDREEDILESQRIGREPLTRLINLTIRATYFTFNRNIEKQIFGFPIGLPLSPLFANVYMKKKKENFEMAPLQPAVLM
ncbi:unnamed protein product [Protopolystoma xenopodis]|uniref:Reverse transcriptase domain-containing protein n=1 Tax=Protopolystoma xenopodis TaxID=117903 RepID=A0A3S5AZH2_9PLAT|nr:unnamed protein product [Protopolystoma xenopodis]